MEETDQGPSPAAGSAPQFLETDARPSHVTNAAIIIGVRKARPTPPSETAVHDATRFHAHLTSVSAEVPLSNARLLVTSAPAIDSATSPRTSDIRQAFAELKSDHPDGFLEDGSSPRNRLWVFASGYGFREPNGRITLLTADDVNSPVESVDLTALVDQVGESGLFKEVIFVADIYRDAKVDPPPREIAIASPSKRLPPATTYFFLTCFAFPLDRATRGFVDFVLDGLRGAARDSSGLITGQSLHQYVANGMNSLVPGQHAVSSDASQKPVSLGVAAPPSSDQPSKPQDAPVDSRTIGGRIDFAREAASDERCLNADDYAASIASLFRSAIKGEFCFAVYGHWGRGKTYLMNLVSEFLQPARYRTVRFSAWKYPSAPEVWIHLYEEFAKVAYKGPWWRATPTILRTGIAQHGLGGLLAGYFLFAVSMLPIFTAFEITKGVVIALYPVIGVMGFIWIINLLSSIKKAKKRLNKSYLSATRHTEKLGLQATIGSDLAALLEGWIPAPIFKIKFILPWALITILLAFATWSRLSDGESAQNWLAAHSSTFNWVIASPVLINIAVVGLEVLIAVLIARWITSDVNSPRRILLVVDDLDRCDPQHLLSVMESIKLLLEEEPISDRVQVAMLIEEDILKHAILAKYRALLQDPTTPADGPKHDPEVLVRENCEKLFLAHLRFPRLSIPEIRDLVETFSGRRRKFQKQQRELQVRRQQLIDIIRRQPSNRIQDGYEMKEVPAGPTVRTRDAIFREVPDERRPKYRDATTEEIAKQKAEIDTAALRARQQLDDLDKQTNAIAQLNSAASVAGAAEAKIDGEQVLTDPEVDAIIKSLNSNPEYQENLGPRTVRALLFRYQLARLLLTNLKINWQEQDLATLITAASFAKRDRSIVRPILNEMSNTQKLLRIVEQVS
jgi:KAP family P-loop domain